MAGLYRGGFDTHTHLDFPAFDGDRDDVVGRARAAGVERWLIAGSSVEDWDRVEAVARATGGTWALGVHPWDSPALDEAAQAAALAALVRRAPPVIGETGLDALHAGDDAGRARQRASLRDHLALARDRDVPVVLHCVRAYPELIAILRADGAPRGVVHAWSGPPDAIAPVVALGLHVAFGPLILRDRARKARASVALVPADRLLLETDAPAMAPPGADRGEPAHLVAVAEAAAALRGEDPVTLWDRAAAAARRLFDGAAPRVP